MTALTLRPARAGGASPVTVVVLTGRPAGEVACGLAGALRGIAVSAFTVPPWNETPAQAGRAIDRMLAEAENPSFVLAFAFTGNGPGLTGFGYGLRRRPAPGSPADCLALDGPDPFEFCELTVRPAARGMETGRALHDAVLTASGPQPRWLITHAAARPAVGLYRSRGWLTRRLLYPAGTDSSPRLLMTRTR